MTKGNFKERMDELRKNQDKGERRELPPDVKICPFQSTADCEAPCTPRCALYRSGKKGDFACPFSELTSMSWHIKGRPTTGSGYGSGYQR